MISLVLLALTAQEAPDIRHLNVKLEEIKLPIIAGAKEFTLGIQRQASQTYSLYVNELESGNFTSQPIGYKDVLIGYTGWSVTPAVIGSTPCVALSSKSHRNQAYARGKTIFELRHQAERTWYITDEGKIVAESCEYKLATGTWKMDATYGAEDYTVTLTAPGQRPRTVTRSPGIGMDVLATSAFEPMLKPDPTGKSITVLKREKEFWLLDPFTGMPVMLKAQVRGSFTANIFRREWRGPEVEFSGYREPFTAWVTHEGVLMRVKMPEGVYLEIEQKPG